MNLLWYLRQLAYPAEREGDGAGAGPGLRADGVVLQPYDTHFKLFVVGISQKLAVSFEASTTCEVLRRHVIAAILVL